MKPDLHAHPSATTALCFVMGALALAGPAAGAGRSDRTAGVDTVVAVADPAAAAIDPAAAVIDPAAVPLTDPAMLDTSEVILDFVSVDSSLFAGMGVFLAFEDTIPFAEGTMDTVYSRAPRITVEEVVRKIGERMASERARIEEHSYTALTTLVALWKPKDGKEPKRFVYESAERNRLDADGNYQTAMVWEREREFEDGELKEEKIEDDVEVDWHELSTSVRDAVPFSLESGDEYNYEILERKLAGMNVIYKLGYTPKSRFKGLTSGEVWVDYGEFVIRRFEARILENPPLPMFIESIPTFKLRMRPCGEFWTVRDVYAEVELRHVPLLGIPERVRLLVRMGDHTINGVAYEDGPDILPPIAGGLGVRDEGVGATGVRAGGEDR